MHICSNSPPFSKMVTSVECNQYLVWETTKKRKFVPTANNQFRAHGFRDAEINKRATACLQYAFDETPNSTFIATVSSPNKALAL
ncbi:hypothetical protein A0J61_04628 [Choanephora cucurbitarum]|uniref:Uncharacterized protein n=1 Tax=Choanephora cucurbitarum TaxID=101091 RepID=A0A1C7NE51_9FUNG|nr:hypothetical protein A0J61_04628 [Choanephora cucurbitarum]